MEYQEVVLDFEMQCVKTIVLYEGTLKKPTEYPCGKCLACKKQRARDWSIRLLHEMSEHERSCFITLTYEDAFYPDNGSISKRELQLFFKRLRKKFNDKKIKYFACGEYGDRTHRAHYHAIIFGIGFKELNVYQGSSKNGKPIFTSKELQQLWLFGFVSVGSVDIKSINYVVGYVMKKLGSKEYLDIEPPFQLQSQGLGLKYAEKNIDKIKNLNLTIQGNSVTIPRYYIKKFGKNQELINERMEERSDQISEYAKKRKESINYVIGEDRYQRKLNLEAKEKLFKRDSI